LSAGDGSAPTVDHTFIFGNSSDRTGAAVLCENAAPFFIGCTIRRNRSTSYNDGSVIVVDGDESNARFLNRVIWCNVKRSISAESGGLEIHYSDVEGGWEGEGNIDEDPLFCDPIRPDPSADLAFDSPCLGAGLGGSGRAGEPHLAARPQRLRWRSDLLLERRRTASPSPRSRRQSVFRGRGDLCDRCRPGPGRRGHEGQCGPAFVCGLAAWRRGRGGIFRAGAAPRDLRAQPRIGGLLER